MIRRLICRLRGHRLTLRPASGRLVRQWMKDPLGPPPEKDRPHVCTRCGYDTVLDPLIDALKAA